MAARTVTWDWTGDGAAHTIEAELDGHVGASDYEFSSGEFVDDRTKPSEYTFDDSGITLSQCEPPRSVGVEDAIVVE
jgi:plastocyanin